MRNQWQNFLEENGNEAVSQLVAQLDEALQKGDIATAQDCLVALWVKHGIALDPCYNLVFISRY